jgi:hypothetical protein
MIFKRKGKMKKLLILTTGIVAGLLSSCATGYNPSGFTGGFSDTKLAPNVAMVHFDGNGFTSDMRAAQMLLLRAADVTLQSGYRFFVVNDVADQSSNTGFMTPGYANTTFGQGFANTTFLAPTYIPIHKPAGTVTITMGISQKELSSFNKRIYDAAYLRVSLRNSLGLNRS